MTQLIRPVSISESICWKPVPWKFVPVAAIVNVGLHHNNLRVLLQIPDDNQLLGFDRGGAGILILNEKPHINSARQVVSISGAGSTTVSFRLFLATQLSHLSKGCR